MALLAIGATPAARCAITGTATVTNDDLYRGRSMSGGRPVGKLGIGYDHATGAYAGVVAGGVLTRDDRLRLLSVQEYAGFAVRLRPELTLDLGVIHSDYSRYWSGGAGTHYVEAYAGLIARRFNARITLSPDYLRPGWRAAYGEINAAIASGPTWDVSVHGGLLAWVAGGRPPGADRLHYDWQISAGRRFGPVQIRAGWAAIGPQPDYYAGRPRRRGRPTLSIAAAL